MHIIIGLEVLVQIGCAVHAVRTGRTKPWLSIIIFVPVVGWIVYLFAVVVPSMDDGPRVVRRSAALRSGKPAELKKQLQLSDTLKNRHSYARSLMDHGDMKEAVEVLRGGLTGAFADDPPTLFLLAEALFSWGDLAGARDTLETVRRVKEEYRPAERDLLLARLLEEEGEREEALAAYESVQDRLPGLEGYYRHGSLLKKMGRKQEAREVFARILQKAERASSLFREQEEPWIKGAKKG